MRNLKLLTAIFPLSMVLISCGGGGDGSSDSSQTVNQATTEELLSNTAVKIGDQLYEGLSGLNLSSYNVPAIPQMPSGFNISSASISKQQVSNCSGSSTGDLTDKDDDGIPVNGTYSFKCTYGTDIIWEGEISARDDDDNDRLSGFDVCTGVFDTGGCTKKSTVMTSSLGKVERIFDMDIDKVNSTYNFTTFYHKWIFVPANTTSPTIYATMESNNLSYTADSDGDNDPWNNGTWNGAITLTGSDGTNLVSINITATDLHITDGCSQGGVDRGTLSITGNCPAGSSNETFNITANFSNCGTKSLTITDCDGNVLNF